jgi:2-polyprenyl-3-methyl-5-hydroxy-6-metoxy-1,4-benzoquinol methylase
MPEQKKYFAASAEFNDELERTRLREQEHDPITIRRLMNIGVSNGWRCLEVGAGGGSIARWLAERVGPMGHVTVVDIDTRFLAGLDVPNVVVRKADITEDELETDAYDVIHCRHLLIHLADPESTVRRFARALKPCGWVLLEEADVASWTAVDASHPLAHVHNVTIPKIFEFLRTAHIVDLTLARSLPELLRRLGMTEVGDEEVSRVIRGGEPRALYMEKSFQRTDDALFKKGVLTRTEIAERQRALEDPTCYFRDLIFDGCWGRRPP